ncbi:MAG: hypothetical protein PHR96_01320 [Clostridia bacterium]|nr:hypothetical protein [Clostridia bacterium]
MLKQAKGGNLGFSLCEKPDFPEENPISLHGEIKFPPISRL